MSAPEPAAFDLRTSNLGRRRAVNHLMEALAWTAALIAVAILGVVVYSVARRGAPALNLDLLTKDPIPGGFGTGKQGLANAFAGTLVNRPLLETDIVNQPLLETEMRFQS